MSYAHRSYRREAPGRGHRHPPLKSCASRRVRKQTNCPTIARTRVVGARIAGVPEEIEFRTKPQIALEQIEAACEAGLPRGVVLMDAGYGRCHGTGRLPALLTRGSQADAENQLRGLPVPA